MRALLRRLLTPVVCVIAALFVSTASRAQIMSVPTPEELQARYPTGSIYLSYLRLNDFHRHLNDTEKFNALVRQPMLNRQAMERFRKYLDEDFGRELEFSKSTAVLQIDFVNHKVMEKKLSDRRGTIDELTQYWITREVLALAILCDIMLRTDEYTDQKRAELKSGTAKLNSAWAEISKLKADPYVQARSVALYLDEFRTEMNQRLAELEEIRKSDPLQYAAMRRFATSLTNEQTSLRKFLVSDFPTGPSAEQHKASARVVSAYVESVTVSATYPARPVRVVVPFPPGGDTDRVGRTLAQKLNESLGQMVVVENRGGASGSIGAELVANASPNGYTILIGNGRLNAINPILFAKLRFDPIKNFAPVSLVASTLNVLVVHPSVPVKTVNELVALAKAAPGTLKYASAGFGSYSQLAGELFNSLAGIRMVHVPYKGAGSAVMDLIVGQTQLMFPTIPAAMPHVDAGKARPLAVTGAKRSQVLPELPTIAESGVAGYEAANWYGVFAPAGTPRPIIARLHGEIVKVLSTPDMRDRLLGQGFEVGDSTPDEFAHYIKSETAKWGKLIRDASIRAQ